MFGMAIAFFEIRSSWVKYLFWGEQRDIASLKQPGLHSVCGFIALFCWKNVISYLFL